MALTNLQRVRVLIYDPATGLGNPDNEDGSGDPNFSDAEIADFLDFYSDETVDRIKCYFAASDLCASLASKAVERSTMISAGGTFVEDAKKLAAYWQDLSKRYCERAIEIKSGENEGPVFDVAEINASDMQAGEILGNRLMVEDNT